MGLPAAIAAHGKRDLELAKFHYERALAQQSYTPVLFQNYGALLREIGEINKASEIYDKGLALFPDSEGIRKNYINLLLETSPAKALPLLYSDLHAKFREEGYILQDKDCLSIIDCLRRLGYFAWAYHVLFYFISSIGLTSRLAVQCVQFLYDESDYSRILLSKELGIEKILLDSISNAKPLEQAELFYALSWFNLKYSSNAKKALDYLTSARKLLSNVELSEAELKESVRLNDINSWNASNLLLQNQQFEIGWKLYDHGLRAPAKGAQAWQRALPKPFTYKELPLWKGESLIGKKILLLEEQAIGDVMQFATLIPTLIQESSKIGLLVSNRLLPIYRRSFAQYINKEIISVYSLDDVTKGKLIPSNFDYQSPLGSICQYRFTHPKFYNQPPVLRDHSSTTKSLRDKYLSQSNARTRKIIGLSWRGGGTSERMSQKSIPVQKLSQSLRNYDDFIFLSLQYGDCVNDIKIFRENGVPILLDDQINAINGFDAWLSQVASCDAVISVANTTIHGSGGLGIPTLCLLSKFIDWRWLSDKKVDQSYWYPSVGIARQEENGSWNQAISLLEAWIDSGCVQTWSTSYTIPD